MSSYVRTETRADGRGRGSGAFIGGPFAPFAGCGSERQAARLSGVPWAALASPTLAGPRSTYATPTAMTAPITGPIR
jgi:hypothetical protein